MSKKLYGLLLPLLAVVAFASMAGAAQAAPHFYKCEHFAAKTHKWVDSACSVESGTNVGEYERSRLPFTGAKTRVKTFGVLTIHNEHIGEVKCFVDDHGKVWNTLLAEPGFDEVQFFENYECESSTSPCTSGWVLTSEGLPWPTELLAGPPIRDKIGTAATPVKIKVVCTSLAVNEVFHGELTPKYVNGTQANGGTSFVEFDTPGSGHLEPTVVATGPATVTGKDFIIGVENAEQILVINP